MCKLLIAADQKEDLVTLRRVLNGTGAEIIEAAGADEVLWATLDHSFTVAILDFMMPEIEGCNIAEQLRSNPGTRNLPIIFLIGAYPEEKYNFKGCESGPVDYIIKPYDPDMLCAKVHLFFDLHRAHAELAEKIIALTASEERFRSLVITIPDIVYRIDPEGRFTFLNEAVNSLGYTPEELLGSHFSKIMLPVEEENVRRDLVLPGYRGRSTGPEGAPKLFDERRAGKRKTMGMEMNLVPRKNAETGLTEPRSPVPNVITVEVNSSGIYVDTPDSGRKAFIGTVGVIRDITERKQRETELKKYRDNLEKTIEEREATFADSELRYRRLFESAKDGILILNADTGKVIDVNPFLMELLGFSYEAFIGKEIWELGIFNDIIANQDKFTELQKKKYVRYEHLPLKTVDGRSIEVEFISNVYEMKHQKVIQCNIRDITERVKEEKRRELLQEQLLQSQKLEAVGRLSAGIAHDFNNILTTIIGNAELVMMDTAKEDHRCEMLKEITEAGEKGAGLIRQLLIFSRKQIFQPMVLNLNEIVKELEKMLRRIIGEDIELRIKLAPDLRKVEADMSQIEQVIMNLCVNAKDAMPEGGHLTIETENVDLDEDYGKTHLGVTAGPYVMLAVSDSGAGMTPEVKSHIFQPFFTTKEQGKGTGLGLSTVYGIVTQNKGSIYLYSEPGEGSVFKIYLPGCGKTSCVQKDAEKDELTLQGSGTVLVVEDNEMVRKTTMKTIQRFGYTVLIAPDGGEALRICREHDGPIHLMLTDVVMPGMGGRDLAERAQEVRTEMKVLFMSGYTDDAIVHHGVLEKGIAFLQKPFTTDRLARKIREVLNG